MSQVMSFNSEPVAMSRWLSTSFDVGFTLEQVDRPFKAEVTSFAFGQRLKLAELSFSPHLTRRRAAGTRTAPGHYLVNHLISGAMRIHQDGREADIAPGDIYIINPTRDFRLETSDCVTRSIYVDANLFRSVYPEVDCCAAVPLRQADGTTGIVADLVSSLFRQADLLSDAAVERCGDAFPHVLAIALASQLSSQPSCPSKLSLLHKERIKTFARDHLSDPELGCEMIADTLRLSQRYIYDVFADEPLTLMRWIRHERLLRCRRELSSPALQNRTVSEIAYSWGFMDLAHFSRVFSAEFGASPRAFRQAAIRGVPSLN